MKLEVQRRVEVRFARPGPAPSSSPALREPLPQPLFPPRTGLAERDGTGWRFRFLFDERRFPDPIDWAMRSAPPRDQLWKMNLHYMEWLEEQPTPVAAAAVVQWIDANRPFAPGFWRDAWNSYTLSLRVVVWMQELARRGAEWPERERARTLASLAEQLRFLERHLELDLGGNHLMKNVKALLWGSAFFAGPEAERWWERGAELLAGVIEEQILADGVHDERSPSYHAQVEADLLECRSVLRAGPLRDRLDAVLARMAQATADLAHPDGLPALFNDAGLHMAYAPGDVLDVHARLFGVRPTPSPVVKLDAAGYFGLHADDMCFLADAGPIAPDHLPAHGHADMLSFEWTVGRRRIVVDPGVHEYWAGPKRQHSRAAASHNAPVIDGEEPCDFFGSFRVGRRGKGRVVSFETIPRGFRCEADHDGYSHLAGAPRPIRRFEVTPERVVLVDRIVGTTAPAGAGLLLHPDCVVDLAYGAANVRTGDVWVRIEGDVPLRVIDATWSPDMGVSVNTKRLVWTLRPGEPTEVRLIRT